MKIEFEDVFFGSIAMATMAIALAVAAVALRLAYDVVFSGTGIR